MKKLWFILLIFFQQADAQNIKKRTRQLETDIRFLSDDKLEGRRTGTRGEQMAYEYLIQQFQKNKINPAFPNGYLQPFEVDEGVMVTGQTKLAIGSKQISGDLFFPLPYSKNEEIAITHPMRQVELLDISSMVFENRDNPHFDLESSVYDTLQSIEQKKQPSFILVYDITKSGLAFQFDKKNKRNRLNTIVVCADRLLVAEMLNTCSVDQPLNIQVDIQPAVRTGHNVAGVVDNDASQTIIIGAHYDHLGYGEDHNSLYTGKQPMVHNGADDNASGTAGLLWLSQTLRQSSFKQFNYVFVAFSGEELGLYGSKYFVDHAPIDLKAVNYMINMDMIGRLNDSTRGLTIGGFGTSPQWSSILSTSNTGFNIKLDSAGSGPSDHTSFYRKDIPVLFFFTGTHGDYHKPSDDAEKINFKGEISILKYIEQLIRKTTLTDRLVFSKTRESISTGKSSFKVTLGIMPDYTFSGAGVHVDGVSEQKPAQKAGIQAGDIILKLGAYPTQDVQAYMKALSHFSKGDKAEVLIQRADKQITLEVVF
jgi:hypothetical protein